MIESVVSDFILLSQLKHPRQIVLVHLLFLLSLLLHFVIYLLAFHLLRFLLLLILGQCHLIQRMI